MASKKQREPERVEKLEIIDTATDGKGVARVGERVVFVEGGVPGDIADVSIMKQARNFWVARIDRLVEASPWRTEPECWHFGNCGGCKWQNLTYEKQLFYKQKQVLDSFDRIGKVPYGEVRPILGVEHPYQYRNKIEFSFSNKLWVPQEKFIKDAPPPPHGGMGFHIARFFDRVIDIYECLLTRPVIDSIRNELRAFSQKEGMSYYNIREHHGLLRNVLFRTSEATGELMMILVIGDPNKPAVDKIFSHLEKKFPEITSFIWVINTKLNNTIADLNFHTWKGSPFITEQLGPWKYRISPTSFFQTNSKQAKVLYDVTRAFTGEKTGTIYDLYCGAGSIGIYVNDLADKIVGIEYVEDAVNDAHENVKLNNLSHLEFYAGNMKDLLTQEFFAAHGKPDVIITDPPRAGMDEPVVRQLLASGTPRIVYVSCNAATQARDIALLHEKYDVIRIQPVDMFPQTSHVENVALLELRQPE